MSFASNLHQTLTYWAPGVRDQYGAATYAVPVSKNCRWESKTTTMLNKQGEEFVTKSRIFLAEPLDMDGFVLLGDSASTDPRTIPGAIEIQQTDTQPDLRNAKTLYTVFA